ncbi:MAG: nucleotidyltransferase family protein [Deltaproteobacteria bacterium]|nr:MAG: nucleotidyltransferase family protein [Deltaproteobacteria bacterium]
MLAVIMAGGEGTRLRPYTKVIPKPLLPVGDKPILEILIRQLRNEGFNDLIITTGYQGDLIKAYFQNGSKFGVHIRYTTEKIRLGTAGALSLIDRTIKEPFLVINGDILTDLSLKKFMSTHVSDKATLTVGIVKFKLDIPYGVVQSNGKIFESIEEKPRYFFDVGAGIYGADPGLLDYLPKARRMDFPELIKMLKKKGEKVICFEVEEYWKDIGIMEDFEAVHKDIENWDQDRLYHVFRQDSSEAR